MSSPFVEALREIAAVIERAPVVRPAEATASRRIARELLETIDRLEGRAPADLTSIVCHDLKDPLASIVMGAGFLKKTVAAEDAGARRVVDAILRSSDRMSQIIGELHDLARIEGARLTIDARPWDVGPLLKEAVDPFASIARDRGVHLAVHAPADPLAASCDRPRVAQIVRGLVGNAMRYTPAEGRVDVRARVDDGAVRIDVADTGCGIPADRLPTIFDYAANARRTPRDGPGLGLAIARGLVELHGGRVGVESRTEGEGRGSTFSFTLPLARG